MKHSLWSLLFWVVMIARAASDPPGRGVELSTFDYTYGWGRWKAEPPQKLIDAIQRAIAGDPKNGSHYFNLAVTYAFILQPPDKPSARTAYQRSLELGIERDEELEKALR